MKREELVAVNREMSLISIREINKNQEKMKDICLSNITLNDFVNLTMIDPRTLNDAFFKEIDLMFDEGVNQQLINNYSRFLAVRERLIENYLLVNWMDIGEKIRSGEMVFEDKPKIKLSDIIVYVDQETNKIVDLYGCYSPEYFHPYCISFDELTKEQKYGFIQSMPKEFVDEKMLAYFFKGGEMVDSLSNKTLFSKKNMKDYLKVKGKENIELIFCDHAEYMPELHGYALSKIYSEECNL